MSDRNTQLMKEMGSKTGRYDPEPPAQWQWQLDHGTPAERMIAWLKSKTVAFGHGTAYAAEDGKALYLDKAAKDLGWSDKTAQNVASELVGQGRIRLDRNNKRIYLRAEVMPQKQTEDGRNLGEIPTLYNGIFPDYVIDFIGKLPPEKQESAVLKYAPYWKWHCGFMRDTVAAARSISSAFEDNILREIGMDKKRLPGWHQPATPGGIQLQLLELPDFVQSNGLYTGENGSVQTETPVCTPSASLLSYSDTDNYTDKSVSQSNDQEEDKTDRPDLSPLLDAFQQIGQPAVNDHEAYEILALAQKATPELELKSPEVAAAVVQRGAKLGKGITSPIRFLRTDIPRYVKSQAFKRWLSGQRSVRKNGAAVEYELPSPPDDDPVVSAKQCGKCGGTTETLKSGRVLACACSLRERSHAATL